jgi:hypothetical protein
MFVADVDLYQYFISVKFVKNKSRVELKGEISLITSKHTKNYSVEMRKLIEKMREYLKVNSIGVFIYYNRFGFSYSIILDMNQMLSLYKSQKKSGLYNFVGELIVNDKQVVIDDNYKKLLDATIKYNL